MKVLFARYGSPLFTKSAGFKKAQFDALRVVFLNALKELVKAATAEGVIRVQTGMSKASIIPLADVVKMGAYVQASIRPTTAKQLRYRTFSGTYNGFKNIERGKTFGKRAFKYSAGSINKGEMSVEFDINVFQYWLNEEGYGKDVAWKSLEKGLAAFDAYMYAHMDDVVEFSYQYLMKGVY
jgi:hypothetical protein